MADFAYGTLVQIRDAVTIGAGPSSVLVCPAPPGQERAPDHFAWVFHMKHYQRDGVPVSEACYALAPVAALEIVEREDGACTTGRKRK